jgi:hypothetical protein
MSDRFAEGFRMARDAASKLCLDFADELDRRPEYLRQAGESQPQHCRRLRQAAAKIHGMPAPYTMDDPI